MEAWLADANADANLAEERRIAEGPKRRERQGRAFMKALLGKKKLPRQGITNILSDWAQDQVPAFNLKGQEVKDSDQAALLFAALRSPLVERASWIVADAAGEIIDSGVYSVGSVGQTYVPTTREHMSAILPALELARQSGGIPKFWFNHNHPTGDVTPSEADRVAYSQMAAIMRSLNADFGGTITNGEHYSRWVLSRTQGEARTHPEFGLVHLTRGSFLRTRLDLGGSLTKVDSLTTPLAATHTQASAVLQRYAVEPGQLLVVGVGSQMNVTSVRAFDGASVKPQTIKRWADANGSRGLFVSGELSEKGDSFRGFFGNMERLSKSKTSGLKFLDIVATRKGIPVEASENIVPMRQGFLPPRSMEESFPEGVREDVRYQLADLKEGEDAFPHYSFSVPGWTERLDRIFVDRLQPLRKLMKQVGEQGGDVRASLNAYLSAGRYDGKVQAKIEREERAHLEPLLAHLKKGQVDRAMFDLYLWARHAPTRNQVGIDRDPDTFSEEVRPFSGMSNSRAAEVIAEVEAMPNAQAYDEAAEMVYKLNARRLELAVRYGFITRDTIEAWRNLYGDEYVPLRGWEFEDEARMATGKGFSQPKRSISRRAEGRDTPPNSPFGYSVDQMREVVVRGEKNRVMQSLLRFVRANPDAANWEETPRPYDEELEQLHQELKEAADAKLDTVPIERRIKRLKEKGPQDIQFRPDAERTVVVWEHGEARVITLADPLLVRAIRNIGPEELRTTTRVLGKFNRYLASVNTSLSPVFMIGNFFRDLLTAGINMSGELGTEASRSMIKRLPAALKAIRAVQKDPDAKGEAEEAYRVLTATGGKVGWFHMANIDESLKKIDLSLQDPSTVKGGLQRLGKFIEEWNSVIEGGVRLAAYQEARDRGYSLAEAGRLAKELTINFNQRGEWGSSMNAFYLFYNAGLQGTVRMMKALSSSHTVRKIVAGITAQSLILSLLNHALSGDDDDGENFWDKIPDYVKERNLIFMLGDGQYIKIPLPYGYSFFHAIGTNIGEMLNGGRTTSEAVGAMANAFAGNFSPIGSDSSLYQTAAPTIFDPLVQWATNETFYGAPIRKEQPAYGVKVPDSTLYFSSVSPPSKYITGLLNRWSGGDAIVPGAIDVNPELLDLGWETATGGIGRTLSRMTKTAGQLMGSSPLDVNQAPVLRMVFGGPDKSYVYETYRENADTIKTAISRIEYYRDAGKPDVSRQFRDEYRQLLMLDRNLKRTEKQLRRLRGRDTQEAKDSADRLRRRFNKTFLENTQ